MTKSAIAGALGLRRRVLLLAGLIGAALAATTAPSEAAFPGANGRIVFSSSRDGNGDIYVMNADGSNVTRLTNDPANFLPAWSPDGRKIAFNSDRDGLLARCT